MAKVIRTLMGDTVDLVARRCYGDTSMAAAILEANPGLAAKGTILPQDTLITLPERRIAADTVTKLWE